MIKFAHFIRKARQPLATQSVFLSLPGGEGRGEGEPRHTLNSQLKLLSTLFCLAVITLLFGGCASTSIKQSWKSPASLGRQLQKVSILAVDERDVVRRGLESRFLRDFRAHGQDAMDTHELLSLPEIKADKDAAAARFRAAGADVILIVRLMDQTVYKHQVQATPQFYVPTVSGYESTDWYGYYTVAFTDVGVVWGNLKQNIYLESSLFDLRTGRRLWSALTLTVLKEDADRLEVADALVAKLMTALHHDGLIPR